MDKIRNSVEDRQSRIAWQTVNEVHIRSKTKSYLPRMKTSQVE